VRANSAYFNDYCNVNNVAVPVKCPSTTPSYNGATGWCESSNLCGKGTPVNGWGPKYTGTATPPTCHRKCRDGSLGKTVGILRMGFYCSPVDQTYAAVSAGGCAALARQG
jgi:hypothetical protein